MKTKDFNELVGLIGIGALTENEALSNNLTERQANIVRGMFAQNTEVTDTTEATEPATEPATEATEPATEPGTATEPTTEEPKAETSEENNENNEQANEKEEEEPKEAAAPAPKKHTVTSVKKEVAATKKSYNTFAAEVLRLDQMLRTAVMYAKEHGLHGDSLTDAAYSFICSISNVRGKQIDLSISTPAIVRYLMKIIKSAHPYQAANGDFCKLTAANCPIMAKGETSTHTAYKVQKSSNVQILADTIRAVRYGIEPQRDLIIFDEDNKAYYIATDVAKLSSNEKNGVVSKLKAVSQAAAAQIYHYELTKKFNKAKDASDKAEQKVTEHDFAFQAACKHTNAV